MSTYYNLLERVSLAMKDYRLPSTVQGIEHEDTGAVVAVVLYFIMKEPKICKKKIMCYLLLLNRICVYKGKGDIFRWQLDEHFIRKFIDELVEFMKKQKLIRMNGNSKSQLVIYEVPDFIRDIFFLIPPNVLNWLNSMLDICKEKKAIEMENAMLPPKKTTAQVDIQQLQETIDKNTRLYSKSIKAKKTSDVIQECFKLVDTRDIDVKN